LTSASVVPLLYTTREGDEPKTFAARRSFVGYLAKRDTLGTASALLAPLLRKDLIMAKGNNSQGKDKKKAKAKAPAKAAKKAAKK
jgi:hypothetical protein